MKQIKVVWEDESKVTYDNILDVLRDNIKKDVDCGEFSSAKEWCDIVESGEWEEISDEDKLIFLAESSNILSITI